MANTTRTIKAAELTAGMRLKRGLYNRFTTITGVSVGLTHTTIRFEDGTSECVRGITVVEVA